MDFAWYVFSTHVYVDFCCSAAIADVCCLLHRSVIS